MTTLASKFHKVANLLRCSPKSCSLTTTSFWLLKSRCRHIRLRGTRLLSDSLSLSFTAVRYWSVSWLYQLRLNADTLCELSTLDNKIFVNEAEFTTVRTLSFLASCQLSFPNVGLKITSTHIFALEVEEAVMLCSVNPSNNALWPHKAVFHIITSIPSQIMLTENNVPPARDHKLHQNLIHQG